MFIVLIRTSILYLVVVFCIRIMGKRQIGELQPFELVITIMISALAALPMQDIRIPLVHGIIPIITLLILQMIISELELKSEKARKIFSGTPSVVIRKSMIDMTELRRQRFNITDLLEELRLQGYFDLSEIHYAILESNGQLSIIPRSDLTPATKKDMNVQCIQSELPIALILDGKINNRNLIVIEKDEAWLTKELRKNGISSPDKLFFAMLDTKHKFVYQYKEEEGGK
jgi:uncharacterized membrane protein YcaP (DUF421 family)